MLHVVRPHIIFFKIYLKFRSDFLLFLVNLRHFILEKVKDFIKQIFIIPFFRAEKGKGFLK